MSSGSKMWLHTISGAMFELFSIRNFRCGLVVMYLALQISLSYTLWFSMHSIMKEVVETSILLFWKWRTNSCWISKCKAGKKKNSVQHFANHCLAEAESFERHCRLQIWCMCDRDARHIQTLQPHTTCPCSTAAFSTHYSEHNTYYVAPELNILHNLNQQAHNTTNNIEWNQPLKPSYLLQC